MKLRDGLASLSRPSVVSGLSFVFLLCGVAFAARGALLPGGPILDVRFLYRPMEAWSYLNGLGEAGRTLYGWSEVTLDLLFPLVYTALFLALGLALEATAKKEAAAVEQGSAPPAPEKAPKKGYPLLKRLLPIAMMLLVVGGTCDLLENVSILYLCHTFPVEPGAAAVARATFTLLKHVTLGFGGLALVAAGVFWVRRLRWESAGLLWLWVTAFAMGRGPVWPIVAFVVLAAVVHWKWLFLAQYLYFWRYPLAAGLLLGFLPQLVGAKGATSLFGNLLVLETHKQEFWVSFLATLVALTIMSMMRLAYMTAAYRMDLPLQRAARTRAQSYAETPADPADDTTRLGHVEANRRFIVRLCPWLVTGRALVFGLLAIPLIFRIWRVSANASVLNLMGGWALAIAVAGIMQWRGEEELRSFVLRIWKKLHSPIGWGKKRLQSLRLRIRHWIRRSQPEQPAASKGPHFLSRLLEGFGIQGHVPIVMMAMVAIAVYLWFSPIRLGANTSREMANGYAPIAYVLLVAGVLIWSSTIVSLLFDRSRVPVGLVVALWLVVGYRISKSDHFYRIVADGGTMSSLPSPAQVVHARHDSFPGDYITVVAASGGGIKASLWTARALVGLGEDVGPDLSRSIVLLSTNSGGSVGAMYYTDAFDSTGLPSARVDSAVVKAAGESSLSAVVWGLAYPDLFRVVSGGMWFCDLWKVVRPSSTTCDRWRTVDRGWAMDRRWEERRVALLGRVGRNESSPAQTDTTPSRKLGDWVRGVRQGWRPAHVFNATAVEIGAAVRFATVALSDPDPTTGRESRRTPGSEPREFADLYGGADVDVVTAARLSASFPWVSPMARPWMDPTDIQTLVGPDSASAYQAELDSTAFHLGDGGYFDNFGVYSALDFLSRLDGTVLPGEGDHEIRRVILIQIRATPEGPGEPGRGGIMYSAFGPLIAMDAVRNSSQIGRNNREIELLRKLWEPRGITLCPVVFELKVRGPLSWHLTQDERDSLVSYWKEDPSIQARAAVLREYLQKPYAGSGECPKALSGN